jgi:hypothetical protein
MGRIVVSENVSLDGVIQDPAGVLGFSRGGWVGLIGGQGLYTIGSQIGSQLGSQLYRYYNFS